MRYEIYKQASKFYGYNNQIVIADGTTIKGRYVLLDSGCVLPSHDPLHGFQKSFCFPLDDKGNTSNDRDYEHDKDAQRITLQIAQKYDSRAIQSPIIISSDGIVFSGNGRAMAGRLAAVNDTDQEYIKYLVEYGEQYGFSKEVLSQFHHPRVVFEVDSSIMLPYTPSTFARFNSQEMKTQSKTERAIKLGKIIDDRTFSRILTVINQYNTLSDMFRVKGAMEQKFDDARNGVQQLDSIHDIMKYLSGFGKNVSIDLEIKEKVA